MRDVLRFLFNPILNNRGFSFPFIFMISALTLAIITYSIEQLKNHQQFLQMEEEQFKMETLTWLAISDFKEDLPYLPLSANPQAISYHYLYGQAWVLYSEKNDGKIALNIRLATNLNTIKEIFLEIIP